MKISLNFVGIYVLIIGLGVAGFGFNIQGAANVLQFTVWILAAVGAIGIFSRTDQEWNQLAARPRKPFWRLMFSRIVWGIITLAFIWHANWLTAFACMTFVFFIESDEHKRNQIRQSWS